MRSGFDFDSFYGVAVKTPMSEMYGWLHNYFSNLELYLSNRSTLSIDAADTSGQTAGEFSVYL